MIDERLMLLSEMNELESLIASTSSKNVLGKMSFEARLENVREELKKIDENSPHAQKMSLTFKGKPVQKMHGILADFAAKATSAFADAFSAIAASLSVGLSDFGPFPNRNESRLLITGTARGSFGFELEGESEHSLEILKKIEDLLSFSVKDGTDDQITEVVDEISQRATKKIHEFLSFLDANEAWCSFQTERSGFSFSGYDMLKKSASRLKNENVSEDEKKVKGRLFVLPNSRDFEIQPEGNEILRGKIDHSINTEELAKKLPRDIEGTLRVVKVGVGRARNTLLSYTERS